jgi:hypothetical protein
MRLKSVLTSLVAVAAVAALSATDAQASHFRYGTLQWGPTGAARMRLNSAVGEVRFDLRVALRRNATQYGSFPGGVDGFAETGDIINEAVGGTRLIFGDGTATPQLRMIVTDFSATENWIIAQALEPGTDTPGITHTYAAAGPYTARLGNSPTNDACCRLGAAELNNRSDGTYPLQTIVMPLSGNRSPVSNLVPIVVVPQSATATFLVPASDPDGDRIRFRLATGAEAGTGFPLHPTGLSIDANTGVATWNNVGLDRTRFWTTQVVIEDLDANGNVKTKTPVDFLLKIVQQQGTAPTCALNPAGPFTVTPGTPVSFVLTGTDADPGDQIILNGSGVPSTATMTPGLPTSGPTGVSSTFAWTPTAADEGTVVISYSATDSFGNQGLCNASITVEVNSPPTITCPGPVNLDCTGPGGTSHTLTVHVGDADGDALTVTWRVDGTLVETDTVPAPASGPTSADVTMTHAYTLGAHSVQATVSDGQAAAQSCKTDVTVTDNAPPVITCTVATPLLWPPNHNMVNVGLVATGRDACLGGNVPVLVSVFADEDDEDPTGDGRFSPDALNVGSGTLLLRSERKGDADGRVYLIRGRGSDGGNTGNGCCTVVVPQNMSQKGRDSVMAQAIAAEAVCDATGNPPAGYVPVGDGPQIGPKQQFSEGDLAGAPRAVRGTSKATGSKQRRRQ